MVKSIALGIVTFIFATTIASADTLTVSDDNHNNHGNNWNHHHRHHKHHHYNNDVNDHGNGMHENNGYDNH